MNKLSPVIVLLGLFLLGCSKDDDLTPEEKFYDNALTSAQLTDIIGIWAIYEVEFDGTSVPVPINYPECDRDFFQFTENGDYNEYIIPNTGCVPDITTNNWQLSSGVIKITNGSGQYYEYVIVELTSDKLVFKALFDADEDGTLDILTFTSRKYSPTDIDVYSNTFYYDNNHPNFNNKILFRWEKYDGFYTFNRYEIYRTSNDCNINNAELISTIEYIETISYIDENPPAEESFCYFLRIYTNNGLLGESFGQWVSTENLDVRAVEMYDPIPSTNSIDLSWEKHDGLYFSHYEISVQNYLDGSGSGYQSTLLTTIEDVNVTTYTDSSPPYVENPVYKILVYDIFGNRNFVNNNNIPSSKESNYKRPEVLEMNTIYSVVSHPNETIIYIYMGMMKMIFLSNDLITLII